MSSPIEIEAIDWPSSELIEMPVGNVHALPKLNGHDVRWIDAVAKGLKHTVHLLQARHGSVVTGVLPLNLVQSRLFGRFLVSLPYLNTGGVWALDDATAIALIDAACDLADGLDAKYLELRHETPISHPRLNFERTDKVHMRLPLPESAELLMKSFKSKLRSQVNKAGQSPTEVCFGGSEHLDAFYDVFTRNMRDLGTPSFSRSLFAGILQSFGGDAELCVLKRDNKAIAAALLVHKEGVSEVPSASSLRAFNATGANMWMYWNLLQRAIERGSETFDFGRSSEGSGTYKFKAQWGAKPHPAIWQYYVRDGDPNEMRPDAGGKRRLVETWKRLPVWFTRIVGPSIVRGIP